MGGIHIPPAEILFGEQTAQVEKELNLNDFVSVIISFNSKTIYLKTINEFSVYYGSNFIQEIRYWNTSDNQRIPIFWIMSISTHSHQGKDI